MTFRRTFVASAIAAIALCSTLGAQAQNIVLKATDTHPAGYPTVVAVESMGKKLEAATSGRIKMQMFPGAVLGQEKEAVEQAQIGAINKIAGPAKAPHTASAAQLMQVCAAHGLAGQDHSALCRSLEIMAGHEIAPGDVTIPV